MLWSTAFWKASAKGAFIFILCSCTHIYYSRDLLQFEDNYQQNSQKSIESPLESTPVNLKVMKEVLSLLEENTFRKEDSPAESMAEMARLCFILGELTRGDERLIYFNKGRFYSELLTQKQPDRVEGHYWLALTLGGIAEVIRGRKALLMVPTIVDHLETALLLDKTYEQAGPLRVLGHIHCEAPAWPLSEGDMNKSLRYLRTAVRIAPENSTNHLYLAKTLIQLDKIEEALVELNRTLTSTQAVLPCRLEKDQKEAFDLIQEFRPRKMTTISRSESS